MPGAALRWADHPQHCGHGRGDTQAGRLPGLRQSAQLPHHARAQGSATEGSAPTSSPQETEVARRAEQKAEELRALGRELADVANVRTFNPRERYKVGEVIWHPEFGRGKVETVLRSSMLVRFASGG